MYNNAYYETIVDSGDSKNTQFLIKSYPDNSSDPYIDVTNDDIAQESFNLLEELTDGGGFRFGITNTTEINLRVKNVERVWRAFSKEFARLTFITIEVYVFSSMSKRIKVGYNHNYTVYDEETGTSESLSNYNPVPLGVYFTKEYKESEDKKYADVKLFSMRAELENVDMKAEYNALYRSHYSANPQQIVTYKDLYDIAKAKIESLRICGNRVHLTIDDSCFVNGFSDAVNAATEVPYNIDSDTLYLTDLLKWIMEINGLVLRESRSFATPTLVPSEIIMETDFSFELVNVSTSSVDKTYPRREKGKGHGSFHTINEIKIIGQTGSGYTVPSGNYGNMTYQLDADTNQLLTKTGATLLTIAQNLINQIDGLNYWDNEVVVPGDLCVQVGDCIRYPYLQEDDYGEMYTIYIKSLVNRRELKGIHGQKDTHIIDEGLGSTLGENIAPGGEMAEKMNKKEPRGIGNMVMGETIIPDKAMYDYNAVFGNTHSVGLNASFKGNLIAGLDHSITSPRYCEGNLIVGKSHSVEMPSSTDGTRGICLIGKNNRMTNPGDGSTAIGHDLETWNGCIALGKYNIPTGSDVLEIGDGTSGNRHNALRILSDGSMRANYLWRKIDESTASSLAGLSEIAIPDVAFQHGVTELYVVVSFPASSTWQSYVDFVVRYPFDYPSSSLGKANYPFMKGYYYSASYNACIAIEPILSGSNRRVRIKTGFSQVTNASATGVYSLTVYYR